MPNQFTYKSAAERFYEKVMPEPNSGCHLWMASCNRLGYGTILYEGRLQKAHRVAWMMTYRDIPEGLMVCHRCDVRSCVNPDHLFLGRQIDNMADMWAKGRGRNGNLPGSLNPMARLQDEQVAHIRQMARTGEASQNQIARQFGVSPMTVSRIVNNQTWRSI